MLTPVRSEHYNSNFVIFRSTQEIISTPRLWTNARSPFSKLQGSRVWSRMNSPAIGQCSPVSVCISLETLSGGRWSDIVRGDGGLIFRVFVESVASKWKKGEEVLLSVAAAADVRVCWCL